MIAVNSAGAGHTSFDEDWAAELTTAAYVVALRHCPKAKWLDLQLELWRALSATVAPRDANKSAFRAADLSAELACIAYRVVLPYGGRRSFLDLELELYQTLRRTVKCAAPVYG